MRSLNAFLALVFALIVACSTRAQAAGQFFKVDYPASTAPGELQIAVTYTLWIPDAATTLRGIIVHQHGAGTTASKEGSTAAYDLHWQALAKKWDCALLGPSYHVLNEKIDTSEGASELWFDPRRGSEKMFLRALAEIAGKSGHPEVATVPWVLWGHSGGGIWADVMTALHPDRVIAAWLRSGSAAMFRTKPEFPQPEIPASLYGVPMMCNPGAKEQMKGPWIGTLATFQEYRLKGAPIGFAPDPRTGHECGDSRYLAIPFLDACLAMRLPEKGSRDQALKPVDMSQSWLAALESADCHPQSEFKGNPNAAVWLPNAAVAKAWAEYVRTGAVGDTTPPPSPTHVRATFKEGQGTEITWEAAADFESGIGYFTVLRDGQELSKVPEKPVGKFGRPLFQSMTYHDTPDQPLPELRYLDSSAKAGETHAYAVVTVNSVGLKSEPAAEASRTPGNEGYTPFTGAKTSWHDGFDRFDYLMDEETLAVAPFQRDEDERFGVKAPPKGQRRCIVIVPKVAAPGNPWSWRGCYWDHQPQAEVELLRRGYHVAFITPDPGKQWDAWYKYLTEQHGLSKKPAFVGMSKGGYNAYTWATANPDKVSCIYSDNPGSSQELLMKLGALANNDVPLLTVAGSIDPLLGKYASAIESIYQQLGGRVSMMIKEGNAHHPHSLRDPAPIADFIVQSGQGAAATTPEFAGNRLKKFAYYSNESSYADYPKEGTYITCRGPLFTECYDRYEFELPGIEGSIGVVVPKTAAPGNPWIFRSNFVRREAVVDLALLRKGFHVVVGPVPYNADGPQRAQWSKVYEHFTSHGFSRKPVMEGDGGAAGEVYAWAIENPDKVSGIYAENPVLRSTTSKMRLLENLAPLAKAGVPLLHVCGSLDPWLASQTRVAETRYKELGGTITVIVNDGVGHYPLGPKDPAPVADLILSWVGGR